MHGVQDWAEVHRLHHREGVSQAAISRRLGMSRNTVARLLALRQPPRYARPPGGSKLDPFKDAVVAMLREDPLVAATVIVQRLRRDGFDGEITTLRDWLRQVRPQFAAAAGFQRTSYRYGEICQVDWWHTGVRVPVGRARCGRPSHWSPRCRRRRRMRWCSRCRRRPRTSARRCWAAWTASAGSPRRWCATTTPRSSPRARVAPPGCMRRSRACSGSCGPARWCCARPGRRPRGRWSAPSTICSGRSCRCGPSPA